MNKKEMEKIAVWADRTSRAFETKEFFMKQLEEWAYTPEEKRKPANLSFTAGHERNIAYKIEDLEYTIKETKKKELKKE